MLEPLAVDPNRSVAPAANSIASARLVFPAPAGPTSAITRVPFADSPAMRLSLRAVTARESLSREALRRLSGNLHRPPVFSRWQEGHWSLDGTRAWNACSRAAVSTPMVDRKGHTASSPAEMPAPAWKDI